MTASMELARAHNELKGASPNLFDDTHAGMRRMVAEVEALKLQAAQNDEARRKELEELQRAVERERFERRDALNKLRYEFEEFVHRKIDKVLEQIEGIQRTERRDDCNQQAMVDSLVEEVNKLKGSLRGIQLSWSRLMTSILHPDHDK